MNRSPRTGLTFEKLTVFEVLANYCTGHVQLVNTSQRLIPSAGHMGAMLADDGTDLSPVT